jgi:nicotinamide phosphoribosyltransferase
MLSRNLVLKTDSYKPSHSKIYPPNSTYMQSYLESRGGVFDHTIMFGNSFYMQEYLTTPVTKDNVEEAKLFWEQHGEPFDYEGWMYIVEKWNGYLPIKIRAVPEGMRIPTKNVLMTVESLDPKVFWVVNYMETLLMKLWYPITVATLSNEIKRLIKSSFLRTSDLTGDDLLMALNFCLHDFGSRGTSSEESAGIGGMSHLINFMGSDTVEGIRYANHYYNEGNMSGFSIPATEHSTITAWGKKREIDAYRKVIQEFGGKYPLFACVSDSYNIYEACGDMWGEVLKQEIIDSGSMLVVRPDSGVPHKVVPKVLKILDSKFGSTINNKGFKILNHVKVIQGDGIDYDSIQKIITEVEKAGFSIQNLAFGMGGALLQRLDRDTQKFAFKCCAIKTDGIIREVSKSPVDDPGKASKGGLLELIRLPDGTIETVRRDQILTSNVEYLLEDIFEAGKILKKDNLTTIRNRVNADL